MIEAIAVMQDKIAAHSFDEPTGELGLPADARSGDRELGGQPRLSAPGIMAACATPRLGSHAVCQWLVGCGMRP